jgi:hypothetical protein
MTDAVIAGDEPALHSGSHGTLTRPWAGPQVAADAEDGVEALDALDRFTPHRRRIDASQAHNVRLIATEEIRDFKADSEYTLAVTADSEALIRTPIKQLLDEGDTEPFRPIRRAAWSRTRTGTRSRSRTASSTASTSCA